jgi:hypothetical protein
MPPLTSTTSKGTSSTKRTITSGAKALQDQLHDLITRLTLTSDHVKNWNESTTDTNTNSSNNNNTNSNLTHAESTSRFINFVREVISSLQKVETILQTDTELRTVLQNIHVPYDLLELLDHTNINPDLYLKGLVNEAMQQLVGLQRRKNALHLLSTTIESRLKEQEQQEQLKQNEHNGESHSQSVVETDTKKINALSDIEVKDMDSASIVEDCSRNNNNNKRELENTIPIASIETKQELGQRDDEEPPNKKQKL